MEVDPRSYLELRKKSFSNIVTINSDKYENWGWDERDAVAGGEVFGKISASYSIQDYLLSPFPFAAAYFFLQ